MATVGERWGRALVRWRREEGHSQALVGRRVGMTPPQLSRMEAGLGHAGPSVQGPVLATVLRFCDELGLVVVLGPGGEIRVASHADEEDEAGGG